MEREKVSDRIILINQGKIIADGTFAQIKSQHSDTLENVFTNLTGDSNYEAKASSFLKSFE
ncbi:MAG: hypothetical protein AAGA10_08775 [Bacteroidota bacterium]